MTEKGRKDFCIECRKETEYLLQKKDIVKNIRDKEYTFAITVAVCAECGVKENLPGLYKELALDYPNPYADMCKQTKTHYILVSSMIEHFIRK